MSDAQQAQALGSKCKDSNSCGCPPASALETLHRQFNAKGVHTSVAWKKEDHHLYELAWSQLVSSSFKQATASSGEEKPHIAVLLVAEKPLTRFGLEHEAPCGKTVRRGGQGLAQLGHMRSPAAS